MFCITPILSVFTLVPLNMMNEDTNGQKYNVSSARSYDSCIIFVKKLRTTTVVVILFSTRDMLKIATRRGVVGPYVLWSSAYISELPAGTTIREGSESLPAQIMGQPMMLKKGICIPFPYLAT